MLNIAKTKFESLIKEVDKETQKVDLTFNDETNMYVSGPTNILWGIFCQGFMTGYDTGVESTSKTAADLMVAMLGK